MHREIPTCRLLVVDDDPFILKTVSHTLHRLGCEQVSTANSAFGALAMLEPDGAIDLVICDLNMPEMDGVEFLRQLADRAFTGGVVLISGENPRTLKTVEDLARARQLAVIGVVAKPVRANALEEMLARWSKSVPSAPVCNRPPVAAEELRLAIESGEIVSFFQPQVEIATGRVVAVEALARWISPTKGILPPATFITVAENCGLIDALTDRIMADGLARTAAWRSQGINLRLAINISMENLKRLDFPDRVLARILNAGLSPTDVILEVTESCFMENPVAALDILVRLRLKKIGLSIDDFGTGYASLAQLRDLPFDELKVDQSFVRGAANDHAARAILESSVKLGKKLGMSVVAEGVENEADWDRVAALGCDLAQGYFIARPLAAADIPVWIDTWKRTVNAKSLRRTVSCSSSSL